MSQPSSNNDDMFFEAGQTDYEMPGEPTAPPAPQYRKQGFSFYTMMLILSFLSLSTAAIIFFMNVRP